MIYTELQAIWAERDRRYALRRRPLTPEQITSVREWRLQEAHDVPPPEQALALVRVANWHPPQHQEPRREW